MFPKYKVAGFLYLTVSTTEDAPLNFEPYVVYYMFWFFFVYLLKRASK